MKDLWSVSVSNSLDPAMVIPAFEHGAVYDVHLHLAHGQCACEYSKVA